MFNRIQDSIGRTILVIFLIKPLIDLTYFMSFALGGTRMSALHVFAGLLFFYLARYRFQLGGNLPPFAVMMEAFIGLHLISIIIGFSVNSGLTMVKVIDFMLRIMDSYLIFITAYLAATRYRYRDASPFVKAVVIGSAFAVVLNVIALIFNISPGVWEAKSGSIVAAEFRRAGLYYDPGVLANVAFFNLIFVIFLMHLDQAKSKLLVISAIVLAMLDLYLIAASKSRAVTVELAMFGMVYLWVFQKSWGKILAPVAAAAIVGISVLVFDIDTEELFVRFESDVTALEGESNVGVTSSGEVSLGSLEGIGSNRGALWAEALTRIVNQPLTYILFGTFAGSVSHSDYIDILARTGLVSLVLYLALIIMLTFHTWRLARKTQSAHDRTLYFMAFTMLICYLFYSLPFRPLGYTTTAWYMWAVIGLAMARSRLAPREAAAAIAARRQKAEAEGDAKNGKPDTETDIPPRQPSPFRPVRSG